MYTLHLFITFQIYDIEQTNQLSYINNWMPDVVRLDTIHNSSAVSIERFAKWTIKLLKYATAKQKLTVPTNSEIMCL